MAAYSVERSHIRINKQADEQANKNNQTKKHVHTNTRTHAHTHKRTLTHTYTPTHPPIHPPSPPTHTHTTKIIKDKVRYNSKQLAMYPSIINKILFFSSTEGPHFSPGYGAENLVMTGNQGTEQGTGDEEGGVGKDDVRICELFERAELGHPFGYRRDVNLLMDVLCDRMSRYLYFRF